jgi:hypothetical protein
MCQMIMRIKIVFMKVNSHIKNIEFNLGQKRGFERKKQRTRDKGQGTRDK